MVRRLTHVPHAAKHRLQIEDLRDQLSRGCDVETLRGYEGAATRAYYEGFRLRIKKPEFAFISRTKRPPKDPINALLSLAYTLVFGEIHTGLIVAGLDPHPGLLHDLRSGHAALASDVSEPYRILVADSFVLDLVNKAQVSVGDFEVRASGGFYLKNDPRRVVLHAWEAFVGRAPGGRGAAPRDLMVGACAAMRRVVLGECQTLDLPLTSASLVDEPVAAESEDAASC